MKFFKHFTDAHRGKSMQMLLARHGHPACSIYWMLVEICAEKLEKEKDEEFTEAHCVFEFSLAYLAKTLRAHQHKTMAMYLRCYADVGLMSFQCAGDVVTISMPKLLECLDRDAKRARTERGPGAPKIKIKKKNKNIQKWQEEEFEKLADLYTTTFPGTTRGPRALTRFAEQFENPESVKPLEIAIKNYRAYLDSLTWDRSAKTTFANFLGTKNSGHFWTDHIKPTLVPQLKATPGSGNFTGGWE